MELFEAAKVRYLRDLRAARQCPSQGGYSYIVRVVKHNYVLLKVYISEFRSLTVRKTGAIL